MLETWFDPVAIAIVLVGSVAATLLRCGWRDCRIALSSLRGLLDEPFKVSKAKASLSVQIRDIADQGFVRAEPLHFGDSEFDSLSDLMITQRSIESLHSEHFKFKEARLAKAQTAINVLDRAAELAPVLGLAGTLIALAHAQTVAAETGGVVEAISMAVITTLYGLIAANFLFSPLSSAVSRRWVREERMRDEVLEWLAFKIQKSSRRTHAPHREVQAA
jgi:chemotaxis protein MotA